jgi:hypothetical protein
MTTRYLFFATFTYPQIQSCPHKKLKPKVACQQLVHCIPTKCILTARSHMLLSADLQWAHSLHSPVNIGRTWSPGKQTTMSPGACILAVQQQKPCITFIADMIKWLVICCTLRLASVKVMEDYISVIFQKTLKRVNKLTKGPQSLTCRC